MGRAGRHDGRDGSRETYLEREEVRLRRYCVGKRKREFFSPKAWGVGRKDGKMKSERWDFPSFQRKGGRVLPQRARLGSQEEGEDRQRGKEAAAAKTPSPCVGTEGPCSPATGNSNEYSHWVQGLI